jgi:hypothetical protein
MPEDTDTASGPEMIGFAMLQNMTDLDRAQEVCDRAMGPEANEFMWKLAAFKAGGGRMLGETAPALSPRR